MVRSEVTKGGKGRSVGGDGYTLCGVLDNFVKRSYRRVDVTIYIATQQSIPEE